MLSQRTCGGVNTVGSSAGRLAGSRWRQLVPLDTHDSAARGESQTRSLRYHEGQRNAVILQYPSSRWRPPARTGGAGRLVDDEVRNTHKSRLIL